jgi:dTDP-4-amino-4,6-dideoxygalactose transaminase
MDPITQWAAARGIVVTEDACQAHGALYKGRAAGTIGVMAAFSFYPTKNLGGAGDGGLVVTNDETLAGRVRALAAYGAREKDQHEFVGLNSRLDSVQAAVLGVKLKRLDAWNRARAENAAVYREVLGPSPSIRLPAAPPDRTHVYHQFVIRVPAGAREPLRDKLKSLGVPTALHYPVPIHLQPAFAFLGYKPGSLPHTEAAAREILSLPIAQHLSPDRVRAIAEKVRDAIAAI